MSESDETLGTGTAAPKAAGIGTLIHIDFATRARKKLATGVSPTQAATGGQGLPQPSPAQTNTVGSQARAAVPAPQNPSPTNSFARSRAAASTPAGGLGPPADKASIHDSMIPEPHAGMYANTSFAPERPSTDDPFASLYGIADVERLFGIAQSRLRYWHRTGFLRPSGEAGARRYYTFQDLISIRTAKDLLERGIHLRTVRKSVEALRGALPRVLRPLAELRVVADGAGVVVRSDDGDFEPVTGQLLLGFDVKDLRDDVVRVLRLGAKTEADRRAAYEHYLEGCRLDEDETTFDRAESAYRRAMELDPALSNALTNLGNLRFRRGFSEEAGELYKKALAIDAAQPEALYNLGFLAYEKGDLGLAKDRFAQAIECEPSFADAHFNLAMAYEELGNHSDARKHWDRYLQLDPKGNWAEIARRHLTTARP